MFDVQFINYVLSKDKNINEIDVIFYSVINKIKCEIVV